MAIGNIETLNKRSVLLTGASSQIGVFAIPRLLAANFHVFAVSRKGKPENYPVFEGVEWLSGGDALRASGKCQYLLSAGPMDLAREYLAHNSHFQSAVIFSSSSVVSKLASGNLIERQLMQEMLDSEIQLGSMADSRGLKLVIFRPTLIYGCGLDTNISRLADIIRRYGFVPVNGAASGLRQPVHADDLASAAVSALLTEKALPRTLALTGGSTLTYAEMVSGIFPALGKPVRLLRLPRWLIVPLVSVVAMYIQGSGINNEMVKRQRVDLVFDDQDARRLLAYHPRPFKPSEKDFSMPDFDQLSVADH